MSIWPRIISAQPVRSVSYERSTWNDLPYKFEAGTPNISGAIGLAAAMDYLETLGIDNVARHEHGLLDAATAALMRIPGVHIHGTAAEKAGSPSGWRISAGTVSVSGQLASASSTSLRSSHCGSPAVVG